jgi:uncharacterized protein YaaQ
MKLVVSIVQSDDAVRLIEALNKRGFRATVINTEGGFLRQGNATILIGIADEEVDSVLALVKEICHTRTQRITPVPPLAGETGTPDTETVDIPVGGAVVFVLNVEQFERY